MTGRLPLLAFVAILVVAGAVTPAWAVLMQVWLNPDGESSSFHIRYQKTVFIEYPGDGLIHDQLSGQEWMVAGSANSSNPGVQNLMGQINQNMLDAGSRASVSDLDLSYDMHLQPFGSHTSIDYDVILKGMMSDYLITKDSQWALVDLGWRGLSAYDPVVVDGVEINLPISIIKAHAPDTYKLLAGTAADDILLRPLINADFFLETPMTNWHFLFDPTGIGVDAGAFGLSGEISEFVFSKWLMGESTLERYSIKVESVVTLDREYTVRSTQYTDRAEIWVLGFGTLDVLDGVDVAYISPYPPPAHPSRDNFPSFAIYGLAGSAAAAGIGFLFLHNRFKKRAAR